MIIALVDLAVLYGMGLIAGVGLGLMAAQKWKGLTSLGETQ
jgi:hypothetical protein